MQKKLIRRGRAPLIDWPSRRKNSEGSVNMWVTDNAAIGGWWIRVSAYDLAGADAKMDIKVLVSVLDEVEAAVADSTSPPEVPEKSPAKFGVPDNLSTPPGPREVHQVPRVRKASPEMIFLRRYGFSRASRSILLILLPFLGIALAGMESPSIRGPTPTPIADFYSS